VRAGGAHLRRAPRGRRRSQHEASLLSSCCARAGAAPGGARSSRAARALLAPTAPQRERCGSFGHRRCALRGAAAARSRRARAMPDVRDLMLQWAERCVARRSLQRLIKRAPQPLGHSRVPAASPPARRLPRGAGRCTRRS
jgi:hypothetical protein